MSYTQQLRITLWKDYLLRKRKPGVIFLSVFCAVAFFSILLGVRLSLPPEFMPTCQFRPRAMPSVGLLPFAQSFICSINNECLDNEENSEYPLLENSQMAAIISEMKPLLQDETFIRVSKSLPKGVDLISIIADILSYPDVQKLLINGLEIRELFKDDKKLRNYFVEEMGIFDNATFDKFFNARLNVANIIKSFNPTNDDSSLRSVICDINTLNNYLILNDKEQLNIISENLCKLNSTDLRKVIVNSLSFINFGDVLRMFGRVMVQLGHIDVFTDIGNMIDSVIRMQEFQKYLPTNFTSVSKLLPELLPLFQSINSTFIDFDLIQQVIEIIDPAMNGMNQWSTIKRLSTHVSTLLKLIQNKMLRRQPLATSKNSTENIADLYQNLRMDILMLQLGSAGDKNISVIDDEPKMTTKEILGLSWKIANNTGSILDDIIIQNRTEPIMLVAKVLDEVKLIMPFLNLFKEKTVIFNNILSLVNDLLIISIEGKDIIYRLSEKHNNALNVIVRLGPHVFNNLSRSLQDPEKVNILLSNLNSTYDLFCSDENIIALFGVNDYTTIENIKFEVCSSTWLKFIEDIISELGFLEINQLIHNLNRKSTDMTINYYNNWASDSFYRLYLNGKKIFEYISRNIKDDTPPENTLDWTKLNKNFSLENWQTLLSDFEQDSILQTIRLKILQNGISKLNFSQTGLINGLNVIENLLDDIQQKLKILFVKNETAVYEMLQPMILESFNQTDLDGKQNYLWKRLLIQEKNLFTIVKYLFQHKIKMFNFVNYEHFQDSFQQYWNSNIDIQTGFQLCIQTITKILELIDTKFESLNPNVIWARLKAFIQTLNEILSYFDNILKLAIENEKIDLVDVLADDFPKSKTVFSAFIVNLPIIIHDFGKSLMDFDENTEEIEKFMHQNPAWPCSKDGLSELFDLPNESSRVFRQIEGSICDNTILNEIKNSVIFSKIIKTWKTMDHHNILTNFRKISELFHDIIMKSETIKNGPKIKLFTDVPEFNEEKTVTTWKDTSAKFLEKHPNTEFYRKNLHVLDAMLSKAPKPTIPLSEIENNYVSCTDADDYNTNQPTDDNCDEILYNDIKNNLPMNLLRFLPTVILQVNSHLTKYLEELSMNNATVLQVMGFSRTSGPQLFYEHFADYILVFVHSFQQPAYQNIFMRSQTISCKKVFKYLTIPEGSPLTMTDIYRLGNYSCLNFLHVEVMEENLILLAGQVPQILYYEGYDTYNATYEEVADSVIKLNSLANNLKDNNNLIQQTLWVPEWIGKLKNMGYYLLNNISYSRESSVTNILNHYFQNETWFEYFITVADALHKVTNSVRYEIDHQNENNQNALIDIPMTDKNQIDSMRTLGYSAQTFIIEQFILRNECNVTDKRENKFFLNNSALQCPFNLSGISMDLNYYYGNETKSQMQNFIIETAFQNMIRNTMHLVEDRENSKKYLSSLSLWQKVIQKLIPNVDKIDARKFASHLYDTYKSHNVSDKIIKTIDDNHQIYTSTLNGFKGEMHFEEPNINKNPAIVLEKSNFVDHVVKLQESLLFVLKHPKLLSFFNSSISTDNFGNDTQAVDKGIEIFHSVTQQINYLLDLSVYLHKDDEKCEWCRIATILTKEASYQISHFRRYAMLICQLHTLQFNELYNTLLNEFKWKEIPKKLANQNTQYTFVEFTTAIRDFFATASVQITLAQSTGLFTQLEECAKDLGSTESVKSIKVYFKLFMDLLKFMGSSNEHINDLMALEKKITPLFNFLQDKIQVLQPISVIVIDKNAYSKRVKDNGYSDADIEQILNTEVYVNHLMNVGQDGTSKNYEKLLKANTNVYQTGNKTDFRQVMLEEVNWKLINKELPKWQHDRIWNFEWLADILDKFEEIFENGNRIMDFEKNISFQKMDFDDLNIVDIVEGVLQFLQKSSQETLINSLGMIINDLRPLTEESVIEDDLKNISNGFLSVKNFVQDGFLPWKYNFSTLFDDWTVISDYLEYNFDLDVEEVEILKNSELNIKSILIDEKRLLNLKSYLCDPRKYEDLFLSNSPNKTKLYQKLSSEYCSLSRTESKQLFTFLLGHLNISTIFDSFIVTTMNNIMSKANITETEIKEIFVNLKEIKTLIPKLQAKFKNVTKIFNKNKTVPQSAALSADTSDNGVDFLSEASTLICGRPLIQNDVHILKALSVNMEPLKIINPEDYNDLPTPFCKELYVNILQMDAGKILWTYLKPLVRGKIIYAPKTELTDNIMNAANFTFEEIFEFEEMLLHLSSGANSVTKLIYKRKSIENLQDSLKSPMMKDLMKMIFADQDVNIEEMKLKDIINEFQGSEKMMSFVNITHELMKCVRKDRMVGVADESALESLALNLANKKELIGGVVFTEVTPKPDNPFVPQSVKYKIRMDVDDVPSTIRLRDLYWSPGPEADFIENLRYFRGFVQMQDMIDQGIINLQSSNGSDNNKYEIYTQQFPYACWRKDSFVWSLYASQGFQACFFLGLIGLVGTSIRYLIKERETRNTSLMKIMGLRMGVHYISWFISSIIEMSIVMTISYLMFVYGDVFPYSNLFVVYIFLLCFGFSVIMFCYMFSPLFKAASAASITVVMLYYLTYMPYIVSYTCEAVLSLWQKIIINLFMSSSFSTSVLYMLRYEVHTTGINWDTFWTSPLQGDPMNFGISFVLVIVDGILYGIIGYFLTKYMTDIPNIKTTAIVANTQNSTSIPSNVGVIIQNISKVYNTGKVALDNVNIQLYKGQITTLLGQNGAGKTTLINILTGMASPTKGQIIINDPSYSNLKFKRQYLGVCPQFSILLDTLTTREHLMFYAQLKSELPAKDVEEGVCSLIESMGLGLLADEPVQKLSEGTRRRVSVAIAFTYGPSLVVLDEPSSGVDPVARRQIWDLIIKHKKNRTILLTTHHFDEADLLSDRIIILHKGKIHCSGTPLYLKENFGKGYQLDVTYNADKEKITSTLETNRANSVLSALKDAVENVSVVETIDNHRIIFDLPFLTSSGTPNNFEKAALILEQQKMHLDIEDFAFNCTTLEKVFVDICVKADMIENNQHAKLNMIPNINTASLENIYFGNNKANATTENDFKLAPNKDLYANNVKHTTENKSSWHDQLYPLFKKRAIHYFHDKKAIFCTLALPTIIAAIAMGLTLLRPPTVDEPAIDLNPKLYNPSMQFLSYDQNVHSSAIGKNILDEYNVQKLSNYEAKLNYTLQNCECTDRGQNCPETEAIIYANPDFAYFWNDAETNNWLIETQQQFIEKRYGGWSVKPSSNNDFNETLTIWYNNKGYHAIPSFTNRLTNAILKTVCENCSISTLSHPLKFSLEQLGSASIRQHVADVGIALVLLCAYSLAVTCGVLYIIGEKKNEEKRLQYLSGVSPNVYWTVSFIWDYIMFIFCIILALIVYECFQLPVFSARLNLFGHLALLLLFGWGIIPLVHIGEKFFKDPSLGFIVMYFINVALGIIPQISLLLIDIFGHASWVRELRYILGKVFLLLPQFAFADGVLTITKNQVQADLLSRFDADTYISPLSWELLGINYVCLFVYGVLAFIINLLIENKYTTFQNKKKLNIPIKSKYLLETANLRKEFKCSYGTRVAVDSLSLKIPPGQCFGLLGVNGAGKSTTFKMLTTELTPTSGDILIEDESIGTGPLTSGKLGYCSQMNSMDPKLTTWQSLEFYAKLKNISNVREEIANSLELFGLMPYSDQRFENLSGGNKRKVCAAVAILGDSPVILMDEPTSGMDPAARVLIAKAIEDITKKNRSVILTSHSMEECETLCSEVAILIQGKIHCIGSPQALKVRFGGGYLISIRLRHENQTYELNALMTKYFPNSKIENQQYCTSQFLIPTDSTVLPSYIFNKMNAISRTLDITDYSIVRSTLDQVFINLVHSQSASNDIENNDIALSMDGISMSSFTNKTYQQDNVTVSRL